MTERFIVRPDREGFSVVDIWTGEAVVLAMTPQTGMTEEDARHTVELFNRRARESNRSIRL